MEILFTLQIRMSQVELRTNLCVMNITLRDPEVGPKESIIILK